MKNRIAGVLVAAGITAFGAATASAAVDYPDTTELTKGEPVTVSQTGDNPAGTEYQLFDWSFQKWAAEQGWTVTINPETGDVTITAGDGAQTGDRHIVRVKAIELNGQVNTAEVYTVVK